MGVPGGSVVKNLPASSGHAEDAGSIPGSGRSPGGGNATHSSFLAWEIPRTEDPGGLLSIESQSQRELNMHTQPIGLFPILFLLNF